MREQQIQWVVLPAGPGSDETRLRISVVVAPRWRTDEGDTMAMFPDFADWPATLAGATFVVIVNGGAEIPATVVGDPPDSVLWAALLPAETPLIPYEFDDLADRPLISYSHARIAGELRRLYARVAAAAPDDPPLVLARGGRPGLDGLLGDWLTAARGEFFRPAPDVGRTGMVARMLDQARADSRARRAGPRGTAQPLEPIPPPAIGNVVAELERLVFFHSRGATEPTPLPAGGEHYRRRFDVHQMISSLGDHPWLARRLGLIIDLEVARADVPESVRTSPGRLGLRESVITDPQVPTRDLTPQTRYVLQRTELGVIFAAATRSVDPVDADRPPSGLMPLGPGFGLEQLDVDGATLKALHLAVTVETARAAGLDRAPLHQPEHAGLAALRTAGISLVESGRARALQQEFNLQLNTENALHPVRWAEQLVRGYRVDVLDATTGQWRSLHRRAGAATAERYPGALPEVVDEGFLGIGLASAPVAPDGEPDPAAELYVPETVATWDGWSMSAPRAGAPLSNAPDSPPMPPPANTPYTTMGLSLTSRAVPGTLPRLRFGRTYRLRLREVDVAGNGITSAEADQRLASPEINRPDLITAELVYRRFEPVPAPTLVPAQHYQDGSSLQRLVIRSDRGLGCTDYAAVTPPYQDHDDRHLAAPKATYDLAEKHGRFDPVIGADGAGTPMPAGAPEVRDAYLIATREKGTFDDREAPDAEPVPIENARPDQPTQHYVVRTAQQLDLPYLPDPLAVGVILFGLPGTAPGTPFEIRFADLPGERAWFEAPPLRLNLVEGEAAPAWDPLARVLTVSLPPAATARVQVASMLADLDVMGVLSWCERELSGADFDAVLSAAKQNHCWLLTPWHDLELVHAVQRPLADPVLADLKAAPVDGATRAELTGLVDLHVASTDKIDLVATWTELLDDPDTREPTGRTGRAQVFDLPVRLGAEHPDSDEATVPYTLLNGRVLGFNTAVARKWSKPTPTGHEFGDTKYRRVRYRAVATTPFRENFPSRWASDEPERFTASSEEVELDVLSRARPAPPPVHYVVPTMAWERSEADGALTAVRRGGGLRVWLGRGWYSSGDGELLGVVVGGSVVVATEALYPLVSFVGQDPIRRGADLRTLAPHMLRAATAVGRNLSLEEATGPVSVVGYEPTFDPTSRRWFCDIELDTEQAYFPIVRLALARYQPHSLPNRHLSRVVLADICQTVPDRTATLVRDPADPLVCTLTVAGPSYTAIKGVHGTLAGGQVAPRMVVWIQEADPRIADPDLRWQPANAAGVVLTATRDAVAYTWTGTITLPADGGPYRLLVVEEETLAVDTQTDASELARRVVYAAGFEV